MDIYVLYGNLIKIIYWNFYDVTCTKDAVSQAESVQYFAQQFSFATRKCCAEHHCELNSSRVKSCLAVPVVYAIRCVIYIYICSFITFL